MCTGNERAAYPASCFTDTRYLMPPLPFEETLHLRAAHGPRLRGTNGQLLHATITPVVRETLLNVSRGTYGRKKKFSVFANVAQSGQVF